MTKKALITGITGQDGSYLAEFLLAKGYEVHGLIRRSSTFNTSRIDHIYQDPHVPNPKLFLHYGDLIDGVGLTNLIREINPDEVYNLGAQSHVQVSFTMPQYTGQVDAVGAVGLLEAIRSAGSNTRFYQASTSELFGSTPPPQNEDSIFRPQSPYAAAKLMAYWCTVNYRDGYGMHATNGILFNHESPRRGETFVTRKITRAVAAIAAGKQDKLFLGNLTAVRDWGFAKEYVESMGVSIPKPSSTDTKPCEDKIPEAKTTCDESQECKDKTPEMPCAWIIDDSDEDDDDGDEELAETAPTVTQREAYALLSECEEVRRELAPRAGAVVPACSGSCMPAAGLFTLLRRRGLLRGPALEHQVARQGAGDGGHHDEPGVRQNLVEVLCLHGHLPVGEEAHATP